MPALVRGHYDARESRELHMQANTFGGRLSRRVVVGGLAGLGASAAGVVFVNGCGQFTRAAPQLTTVPRVGFVTSDPADAPWVTPLWDGLRELGWVEGRNIAIER